MASPQVEQGHVRIANELYDEILRRSFSKRQQNLVLFIWRLSYGTGQKDCEVQQFNLFELSGIYKSDIKKELNYLRECAVLDWDEKTMIFSINKNYKLWQISPNKNWDSEKFKGLIHHNLGRKKVSKTLTTDRKKVSEIPTVEKSKVSKTLTFKSDLVSKTLTMELVKHQPSPSLILSRARRTESLYPLLYPLKIKDIKDINNNNGQQNLKDDQKTTNPFTYYTENFEPHIPPAIIQKIDDWLDDFSEEMLVLAMEKSIEQGSEKATWAYANRILVNWHKKGLKTPEDVAKDDEKFYAKQNRRFDRGAKPEVIPDWFKNRKNQNAVETGSRELSPEQAEKERQEIAAMISKYS